MNSLLAQYFWYVQLLALIAGVIIAVSSVDDLIVDAIYWVRHLFGLSRSRARQLPDNATLEQFPEQPFAVMVPCWNEHEVIFSMLSANSRLLRYGPVHYFVGTYQNDALTQQEVRRAQALYPNIHLSVVPHDGPTSKADCLNHTVADIFAFEAQNSIKFAGIAMHDSEDLIHPMEMKLFNFLVREYDFVQLPVYSFARALGSMVAGTYMDEFAEMHTKDLEVRQHMSGVIPCAGVSACFTREALMKLMVMNNGEAFRTSSFTEDYDIAFRISELGLKSAFIAYDAYFAIDIDTATGAPAIVNRTLPIATREYFPRDFRGAYRQRARWMLGIVFQGHYEFGWRGSLGTKYFLMRDRKGLLTAPAAIIGYFVLANFAALEAYRAFINPDLEFTYTLFQTKAAYWLFFVTFIFLLWRLANRMLFTGMIYDWRQALMAAPRLVVGNFVNFFAAMRAIRVYSKHRIEGAPLKWDKTSHSYPVEIGDLAATPPQV